MKYWYDIIIDSETKEEKLIPFLDGDSPSPIDLNNLYPVPWGVLGYIYFDLKDGAVLVNSSLPNLEGKSVYLTIK